MVPWLERFLVPAVERWLYGTGVRVCVPFWEHGWTACYLFCGQLINGQHVFELGHTNAGFLFLISKPANMVLCIMLYIYNIYIYIIYCRYFHLKIEA